jgi:hypothetical protein
MKMNSSLMLSPSRRLKLYGETFLPPKVLQKNTPLRQKQLKLNSQPQKTAGNTRRKLWIKKFSISMKGRCQIVIPINIFLTLFIRYKNLSSQNAVLHQHLESVSSQAARIREAAGASSEAQATEAEGAETADTKVAELRSVVSYLRREKGIVDLQHQLASDENARLKRQIEHLSKSLQDTQTTLSEVSFSTSGNCKLSLTLSRNVRRLSKMLLQPPSMLSLSRELINLIFFGKATLLYALNAKTTPGNLVNSRLNLEGSQRNWNPRRNS